MSRADPKCPDCGHTLLESEVDPSDPYLYCVEEDCDWTGYYRDQKPRYALADLVAYHRRSRAVA